MANKTTHSLVSPLRAALAAYALSLSAVACAAPVVLFGSGVDAAALQATVDQFRTTLGGVNNGVGPPAASGRREINWDGVPDSFAAPNFLPPNFFNANSPRGAVFSTVVEEGGTAFNSFLVSADSTTAGGTPLRFGDINPQYSSIFTTFSSERLFSVRNGRVMEVSFFVPGSNTPATVSGFGIVLTDVDSSSSGNRTLIRCVAASGAVIGAASAPVFDGGLSFIGISFSAPEERCARIIIIQGNSSLLAANSDGGGVDVVAMDDFIYGEPRPVFGSGSAP